MDSNVVQRRKTWYKESMVAATNSGLHDYRGLRKASRLNNVPYETPRRHITGSVEAGCKPGPSTVHTKGEEDRLASYLLQMSEMGLGLSHDIMVMHLAYQIIDKAQRNHPFKHGKAGGLLGWMDGLFESVHDSNHDSAVRIFVCRF